MTAICLPIDASAGSPQFAAAQHRAAQGALIAGRADRPLGALSGVRPGGEPSVTAAALAWSVDISTWIIDPETAQTVGSYLVAILAAETGAYNAPDGTYSRLDRLDLQVPDDPPGADPRHAVVVYTAGVAASSPALPAAPLRSTPISSILVPRTGAPTVTPIWKYTAAAGGIVIARDSSGYPAHPHLHQYVHDIALKGLLYWDGTEWIPVTTDTGQQALTGIVAPGVTGSDPAQYRKEGKRCTLTGLIACLGGANFAASSSITLIPAGGMPAGTWPIEKRNVLLCSTSVASAVRGILGTDGSLTIVTGATTGPYIDLAGFGAYFTRSAE